MKSTNIETGEVYAVSKKNKQGNYNVYGRKGNYGKPAKILKVNPSSDDFHEYEIVCSRKTSGWFNHLRDHQKELVEEKDYRKVQEPRGKGNMVLVEMYPNDDDNKSKIRVYKSEHVKMEWSEAKEKLEKYKKRKQEQTERQQNRIEEFNEALHVLQAHSEDDLDNFMKIKERSQKIKPSLYKDDFEQFLEFLPYDTEVLEDSTIRNSAIAFDLSGVKAIAEKFKEKGG